MTEKKIRATLGETVIVGAENFRNDSYLEIKVAGSTKPGLSLISVWFEDGWSIEYIQELPTKPGAIVRNLSPADGALYVRRITKDADEYTWIPLVAPDEVWGDDTVSEGGFEVLFEGVE